MTQHEGKRGALAVCRKAAYAAAGLVVGLVAMGGTQLWAHTDPGGSTATGVGISLTAFRADQVTPVLGGPPLSECEKIFYRATLSALGPPNAAFEDGSWSITTPDGVVHNVTPVGGVPCIGGTTNDAALPGGRGADCADALASLNSEMVQYVVSPADIVAGQVSATTNLAGAFAHIGANDLAGVAAMTPFALSVVFCDDGLFCNGAEICNPAAMSGPSMGICQPGTPPNCPNTFCSIQACNEDLNACASIQDISDQQCPDSFCRLQTCNDVTDQCDMQDISVQQCPDNLFCSDVVCDDIEDECDTIADPTPPCVDTEFCTDIVCDEVEDECDTIADPTPPCVDTEFCTDIVCDEVEDECDTIADPTPPCVDNLFCEDVVCDEGIDDCVETDVSDEQCPDDPENVCEDNTCVEGAEGGGCVVVPAEPLPEVCVAAICRTPGFWGTHGGEEKPRSQNITQALIDFAGGLSICGESIINTDVDDAASAIEAICKHVAGKIERQLARQLTAAALNCVISGGGADCAGSPLYSSIFSSCNDICADKNGGADVPRSDMTACIAQIDCLNNGGIFEDGICDGDSGCHDRTLVNEALGLDFEPPGPAGSSDACQEANQNGCGVLNIDEGECSVDSDP